MLTPNSLAIIFILPITGNHSLFSQSEHHLMHFNGWRKGCKDTRLSLTQSSLKCLYLNHKQWLKEAPIHITLSGKHFFFSFPLIRPAIPKMWWVPVWDCLWIYKYLVRCVFDKGANVLWESSWPCSPGWAPWIHLLRLAAVCFLQRLFIKFHNVLRTSLQKASKGLPWFCNQLFHLYFINGS